MNGEGVDVVKAATMVIVIEVLMLVMALKLLNMEVKVVMAIVRPTIVMLVSRGCKLRG